jgi:predicted type IV restriction endonuclease
VTVAEGIFALQYPCRHMKIHLTHPSPSNSEWLIRKRLVDSMLTASGWKVAPYVHGKPLTAQHCFAIEEYPTAAGPADYALCADGQIIVPDSATISDIK